MKRYPSMLLILALAAQQAAAQSAVSIYGVVDLGIVSDSDSGKTMTKLDSSGQTPSRIGFKGDEDLGGGMHAQFQLESQLEPDTGTYDFNKLFGSQAWVGLSGAFGSIKLGRQFTPYFGAIAGNDPFDAKGPGESTRIFWDSGVRMDNAVKYSLPPIAGGWYADLAWAPGEVAGNSAAGRQLSADIGYRNGPLNVQVAHHDANDALGNKAARSSLVSGTYDFGPLKAWMALARSRNDNILNRLDTRDALAGITVPVGADWFAADYVHKSDRARANAGVTQIAAGYYHPLSRRTNVYLVGSRIDNDGAASYQATLAGGSRRQLMAGLRHLF
jgi:predicted porin